MTGIVIFLEVLLCLIMAKQHWQPQHTHVTCCDCRTGNSQYHCIPPLPPLCAGIAQVCTGLLVARRGGQLQQHGRSRASTIGRIDEARQQAPHCWLRRDLRASDPVSARSANMALGSRLLLPNGVRTRGEHRCSSSFLQLCQRNRGEWLLGTVADPPFTCMPASTIT